MTFVVGFARPDLALLATDTRVRWRNGHAAVDRHKIYPLRDGWMAGCGEADWTAGMAKVLAGTDGTDATRRLRLWAKMAIVAESPDAAEHIRAHNFLVLIGAEAEGRLWRRVVDWKGDEAVPADGAVPPDDGPAFLEPAGLPTEPGAGALLGYYRHLIAGADLAGLLDATHRFHQVCHVQCGPTGSVSPYLDIALVRRDPLTGRVEAVEVRSTLPETPRPVLAGSVADGLKYLAAGIFGGHPQAFAAAAKSFEAAALYFIVAGAAGAAGRGGGGGGGGAGSAGGPSAGGALGGGQGTIVVQGGRLITDVFLTDLANAMDQLRGRRITFELAG